MLVDFRSSALDREWINCQLGDVKRNQKRPKRPSGVRGRPVKRPKRDIHDRITQLREAAKLTKSEFARRCGVDKSAVTHWESGRSAPSARRMPEVASVLDVTLDELYAPVQPSDA